MMPIGTSFLSFFFTFNIDQEHANDWNFNCRYQGMLRPEEIYELLAARTDYKKIQKYVETKECIIQ
jgi:hypothetical protein